MRENKMQRETRRVRHTEEAIKKATKYCDWGDIYDMACLVEGVETYYNLDNMLNVYRNTIAVLLGFRESMPQVAQADIEIPLRAEKAIVTWAEMRGYVKPWKENLTS